MADLENPLAGLKIDKVPSNKVSQHPVAAAKEAQQQSDKSEELALEVTKVVGSMFVGNPPTKEHFTEYCELVWQWMVTDSWPPK